MIKSNEAIEECLKNINRRLTENTIENKEEHKKILQTLKEVASEKVDKTTYDNSLQASTKDKEFIEKQVDKAWNELVTIKEKDIEFRRKTTLDLAEMKPIKKLYDKISGFAIGVIVLLGSSVIALAAYIKSHLIS